MRCLDRDAPISKCPGGVGLHALGEAFETAAEGEIAHLRQNIARHAGGISRYITVIPLFRSVET
jgi:hypothetical protein